MSDTYKETNVYECTECGDVYDHPSLAEKCATEDRFYKVAEEIAELRIRGGECTGHEHSKLEVGEILDELREERDELEQKYGDDCDHGDYMKKVKADGGVYCSECGEMVNEHPKDPETFTL